MIAVNFILINAIISGIKTALFVVPTILLLLLAFTNPINSLKWLKNPRIIVTVTAIVMVILLFTCPYVEYYYETSTIEVIKSQFQEMIWDQEIFLWHGLGTATNAARIFGRSRFIGTFYLKILHEIGAFGVLIFLAVVTNLTFLTCKSWQLLKEQKLINLGICLWMFVLFISYNTLFYPLDVDPVAVYYWFLVGVLLKLPQLDTLSHST